MSEAKKEKTAYKLYVMRTADQVIDHLSAERFVRITPEYTLFYTADKNIMQDASTFIQYTIIGDEDVDRLSAPDREWLMTCNLVIIAEEYEKNQDLVLQNMSDALDVLERELVKDRPDEGKEE